MDLESNALHETGNEINQWDVPENKYYLYFYFIIFPFFKVLEKRKGNIGRKKQFFKDTDLENIEDQSKY